MPVQWYVAEIPMNGVKYRNGHASPADYDRNLYKVIFTKADMRTNKDVTGKDIIKNVMKREYLAEAWISLKEGKVTKLIVSPESYYKDTPVAIY
jgi:hypothetical protein